MEEGRPLAASCEEQNRDLLEANQTRKGREMKFLEPTSFDVKVVQDHKKVDIFITRKIPRYRKSKGALYKHDGLWYETYAEFEQRVKIAIRIAKNECEQMNAEQDKIKKVLQTIQKQLQEKT